jgi:Mn-dependent DtxR family transcriptional regulator
MARKSIDAVDKLNSRDGMWKIIRQLGEFTLTDIYDRTVLNRTSIGNYVRGLAKAGYVEEIPGENAAVRPGGSPAKRWRLIKDVGLDAPRVRKDGAPVVQGQGNINMWQTMKILKVFSAMELAVNSRTETCFVKESTAASYCKHLHKAGYLKKEGKRYRFIKSKNTGKNPPMIQRTKQVWDPNLEKVMWSSKGEDHDE